MIPREIIQASLFVVAILSAAFFFCGFLHLLCRILHKNRGSGSSPASEELDDPEMDLQNPFQRQLQQLFHLHDSGLDQAFVDALPVFLYKDIVEGEEHFDCAVCLCEFSEQDKLRLLPPCGHAFHIECIDTWLLSNSICLLCRGSLYCSLGFGLENPVSEFDDRGENDRDGCSGVGDCYIVVSSKRVFSVRLGKLRGIPEGSDRGGLEISTEETSSSSLDARRCYSMGSYRYVVSDTELQVETCAAEISNREGDQHSEGLTRRKFVELGSGFEDKEAEGMRIGVGSRGVSFSVSKIWQWSNKKRNSKLTNMSADSRTSQQLSLMFSVHVV